MTGFWNRADREVHEAITLCGIVSREGRPAPHVPGSATVDYRDVSAVVRKAAFVRPEATDHHYLTVSRLATVFWGVYAVATAQYAKSLGSLVEVDRFTPPDEM